MPMRNRDHEIRLGLLPMLMVSHLVPRGSGWPPLWVVTRRRVIYEDKIYTPQVVHMLYIFRTQHTYRRGSDVTGRVLGRVSSRLIQTFFSPTKHS